jgi:hypothetical protein
LGPAERAALIPHLEQCADCNRELKSMSELWKDLELLPRTEPSPALDARFETMLSAYRVGLQQAKEGRPDRLNLREWLSNWSGLKPALQFALVLLLFSTGVLVGWVWREGPGAGANEQLLQVQQLRTDLLTLKEQMALALLEQQSAAERLRGVEWTSRLGQPNEEVLGALLRALDSDPNVNVRLAAIEALQPFTQQAKVKKALIDSLPRQPSPLVQIELIQLLVEKQERDSTPVLKSLTESRELDESVRERARWGLSQLGV